MITVNAKQLPIRSNGKIARRSSGMPTLRRLLLVAATLGVTSCGGGGGSDIAKFSVGGSVSGLAGSGLVLLDNGTDHLGISANGSFAFSAQVQSGQDYGVTVQTQPANPTQVCTVTGGSGTVGSSAVTSVSVACVTQSFSIGVTVNGLTGSGLVLQDNGADDLAVAASGPLMFSTAVASGEPYDVTIKTQPSNPAQNCSVSGGSGTVTATSVTSIVVNCDTSQLSLIAGQIGGMGDIDRNGRGARFSTPGGTATDASGNVYVADSFNNTIRKITAAGVVTTLAGTAGMQGSTDATGASARFSQPGDVVADASGTLYVADTANHTIRKITAAGGVTTLAGLAGSSGSSDGSGSAARFNTPGGIAIDSAENLYVADTLNNTIRKITPAGVVTTIAGVAGSNGSADGPAATATFFQPAAVAVDVSGNVFVADTFNFTVRKIAGGTVTTLAGTAAASGSVDGTGANARFSQPRGIATDATGNIFVNDSGNYTVRQVTPQGVVTTLAGTAGMSGSVDGTGAAARFSYLAGLRVDAHGSLLIADSANDTVRRVTAAGVVTTFAGTAPAPGSADQTGTSASFWSPLGISADAAGNTYVADYQNHTIRKVSTGGVVTTFAGSPGVGGSADGTGSAARFAYPYAVAADSNGMIYVADTGNYTVRAITPAGLVTTLAGSAGMSGAVDGTGAAARFAFVAAIAADGHGNLYVADGPTIRKVTIPDGIVTTLAGMASAPDSVDGTGSAARFYSPEGIAIGGDGNVYVSDFGASNIRVVTPAGVVTTLAGTAFSYGSADGDGAAARFNGLQGISIDTSGNLYCADSGNETIRRITPSGSVTTVVGVTGSRGVALEALPASLNQPSGIAVLAGNTVTLAISSTGENAILRATLQ